jgi:acyl dehydratase
MVPGASLLPFIPGGGKEIPEIELTLPGVRAGAERVADYARVCGFSLRDTLPPTYPHVLAFPLHMAVMAEGSFPFGAVGLVHVENEIVQQRPIDLGEELTIKVKPTKLVPHPKGRTFSLQTKVKAGNRIVWESTSTMLRRGGGTATTPGADAKNSDKPELHQLLHPADREVDAVREENLVANAEWRLGGDLGRRYAAVSGDRNPIHMHAWTAKPLGFPRAIAHGMWTKARCLAAIESRLPDAFEVGVRFRKPILLPGRVEFTSASEGDQIAFAVRDAKRGTPHLDGHMEPLEAKSKNGRK